VFLRKRYRFLRRSQPTIAIAFVMAIIFAIFPVPIPAAVPATPAAHPLPPTLANWRDLTQSGDYFDQIKPIAAGYLVWSSFPITVYIESITTTEAANPFTMQRSQTWIGAVQKAIQEWNAYLPLQSVAQSAGADIVIGRSPPPLRLEKNPKLGSLPIPRARSAETRFDLYAKKATGAIGNAPDRLAHRMTITIRPDQAADYLQAAARHELGHALGIWGHSPNPTDALYFSQVRSPAKISARDLNTLKRVYEQPTHLGWEISP
jgi:predicted Zn-dependent protease